MPDLFWQIATWIFVFLLIIQVLIGILSVGDERKPWSREDAAARLITNAGMAAILIYWVSQ